MKLLFLIILFSIQIYPSIASYPNGKGIICSCGLECEEHYNKKKSHWIWYKKVGWFFENNKVKQHRFGLDKTKIVIDDVLKDIKSELKINIDKIIWKGFYTSHELNRKTLILRSNIHFGKMFKRQCVLYKNKNSYFRELKKLKRLYQNEVNEKMSDNKI